MITGAASVAVVSNLHHHASELAVHTHAPEPSTCEAAAPTTCEAPQPPHDTQIPRAQTPPPATAAVAPVRRDFAFTFRLADTTYMALAELPDVEDRQSDNPTPRTGLPKHGPLRLVGDRNLAQAAAATLSQHDLPPEIRAWQGREVVVGGTCVARVTGFELVSRSLGGWEWHYSAEQVKNKTKAELAQKLFTVGKAVIAAKLDGCTGLYARDASRPAIVRAIAVDNHAAAQRATKKLIASPEGKAAGRVWKTAGNKSQWDKAATIKQLVVRHPKTGSVYVSVHAVLDEGCGGADINLWRLYQVTGKDTLTLIRKARPMGVHSIDELVDLNGDGQFEFIVHDSTVGQDAVLWSADGSERMRLTMPYYGCPC